MKLEQLTGAEKGVIEEQLRRFYERSGEKITSLESIFNFTFS